MITLKDQSIFISKKLNLGITYGCTQSMACDYEHIHPYHDLYDSSAFNELFECILDKHYIYIGHRDSNTGNRLLIRLDDDDSTDTYDSNFRMAFINSVYKLYSKEI
ncbi:MAG TPA: hypothetical protein VNX68_10720 [Nitrosopumilaceae archaeon]|jgi:hypothetical protein|nr:hypothetical protein [Nitrosopumilaceae archaeon]